MSDRKSFRCSQLKMLGWVAILIGPATALAVSLIHGYDFPDSISQTATVIDKTVSLLPFALGALSLFSLSYSLTHAYDIWDRVLTVLMCIGFTIVAFQPCASSYLVSELVGVFAISQTYSGWVHNTGALIGFGSMILWVLRFTKSDKVKSEWTKEKRLRNKWYFGLSLLMTFALVLFIFDIAGAFVSDFPIVFWVECFVLVPCGVSCLIKGGLFFRDKI